ncbi:MEMO1 family protein [bacterium]|nr:MEMO1 family protein [bacterium]
MLGSGGLTPHPPILVPEIGRGHAGEVASTIDALNRLVGLISSEEPDVLIMSGPHHHDYQTGRVGVVTAEKMQGDFARFGASDVQLKFDGVPEIGSAILGLDLPIKTYGISSDQLDWGYTVFLYFADKKGWHPRILPMTMTWGNLREHYEFGAALARSLEAQIPDKTFSYVASGDLSHCTRQGQGREYDAYGREFDEIVVNAVRTGDVEGFLGLADDDLVRARQCGAFSFAAAMGFYSECGAASEMMSYEDPFGVGYLVGKYEVVNDGS